MNTCIPKLKSDLFLVSPVHDTELIIPSGTILPANWHADIQITNNLPSWELKIVFSDSIPGIPGRASCAWKVANANTFPGQDGIIHIELAVDYDGWISLLVFCADRQLFSALSNGKMPQAPIEVSEEISSLSSRSDVRDFDPILTQPSKTSGGFKGSSGKSTISDLEPYPGNFEVPQQNPMKKKQSTFAARIRVELAKNDTFTTDDPPPILNRILSKSSTSGIQHTSSSLPLADSGPLSTQAQTRCVECDAVMPPDAEACPWCSVSVR